MCEYSFSTVFTTLVSCFSVASKNISRVSFEGWDPVNCGGGALALPLAASRFQVADFARAISLGLNWKSSWNLSAPGADSEPSVEGSWTIR